MPVQSRTAAGRLPDRSRNQLGSADWNNDLVPGKVVSDETDGSLRTPPLLTYTISTHWMNNGYRQLSREVFVAVADFPVPKAAISIRQAFRR